MKKFAEVILFIAAILFALWIMGRFLESEGIPTEDSTDYYDRE